MLGKTNLPHSTVMPVASAPPVLPALAFVISTLFNFVVIIANKKAEAENISPQLRQ
jgi:hypothetical protein